MNEISRARKSLQCASTHSMYEHSIGCIFDTNDISARSHDYVHCINMYLMSAGWL